MTAQNRKTINQRWDSAYRPAIVVGLIAAFALRLHRLGAESLWYDETVSAFLARQSIADMLAHTALDIHPPGYYALLHMWAVLTTPFGTAGLEYLLAFPSVFFSIVGIALLAPIGLALLGRSPTSLAVWLAAISPILVWYSQEVRMYSVAGAIGLVCFLAALRFVQAVLRTDTAIDSATAPRPVPEAHSSSSAWRWLAIYIVAAAAGLYTLYYLAFALLAINISVLLTILLQGGDRGRTSSTAAAWIGAQFGVVALFSLWLPLVTRQVLDPPVPPWREPWPTIGSALADISTAIAAMAVGQSIPTAQVWFWAIMVVLLFVAYYDYTKFSGRNEPPLAFWLPVYVLVPLATIVAVSALLLPLFHVRYLATYAPAFSLIAAASLVYVYRRWRALFGLVTLVIVVGSIFSISRFWRHPDYRPDDHRSAVAYLAGQWRPGDAILANAGWVYTAIDTYWPASIAGPFDTTPPTTINWKRLTDAQTAPPASQRPTGFVTGSLDGDPSLGWGSTEADFYAISDDETVSALDEIDDSYRRVWHYRLYDTVNDPEGLIRQWLQANLGLQSKTAFAGTGSLLLEEYNSTNAARPATETPIGSVLFDNVVAMAGHKLPPEAAAGAYVYVPVTWRPQPEYSVTDVLASSLRLTDEDGRVWAQHDESLPDLTQSAINGTTRDQILALPVPAATPPGTYDLRLVVYRPDTLVPLQTEASGDTTHDTSLGPLTIAPPESRIPSSTLTVFDYLELVHVSLPTESVTAGETMHLDLVWRPAPSAYQDAYLARVALIDDSGESAATWKLPLGPAHYPSSAWLPELPVRVQLDLPLPDGLETGEYSLSLEVIRASDGLAIPSRPRRWLPMTHDDIELGTVTVD